MKKHAWTLSFRVLYLIGHLLILLALGKVLLEIQGSGSFSLKSTNEWGYVFLKYATLAAIVSSLVFPVRLSFFLSGLVMGGLMIVGLKDGRDAIDLASVIDPSINPNARIWSFVEITTDGYQLILGVGITAALMVIGTLMKDIPSLPRLIKKGPKG